MRVFSLKGGTDSGDLWLVFSRRFTDKVLNIAVTFFRKTIPYFELINFTDLEKFGKLVVLKRIGCPKFQKSEKVRSTSFAFTGVF